MNCSIQPSLALRRCLARASAASFVQLFAQRCVMVGITVGVACTSGHSMQSGGAAITPGIIMPGDLSSPVLALHGLFDQGFSSCLGLRADGSVFFIGGRVFSPALNVTNHPPLGPFVQVVGSHTSGFARRSDGSLVGWPLGVIGTVAPAGSYIDVSASGQGAAAIRSDGRLRTWGWFLDSIPTQDAGPYIDVEMGEGVVVARLTDGTLRKFGGTSWGAPQPPAGSFVEHKIGGTFGYLLGIARRADGTLASWGTNAPPSSASFSQRSYSKCVVGPTVFGGITSDGDLWLATQTFERRFEGPFVDAAIGAGAFFGLLPDGSVVKQLGTEGDGSTTPYHLVATDPGVRLTVNAVPPVASIMFAGDPSRTSSFIHCEDGTVRVLDRGPWPEMPVGEEGIILRDVIEVTPIFCQGSVGGALIARTRSGELKGFATRPVANGSIPAIPYRLPSGAFRRFVGESVKSGQRRLFAIDSVGNLVRWNPVDVNPITEIVMIDCVDAIGQGRFSTLNTHDAFVMARGTDGVWCRFGAGDLRVFPPPSTAATDFTLFTIDGQSYPEPMAFAKSPTGNVVIWGAVSVVTLPSPKPVVEFGISFTAGFTFTGCSIFEDHSLEPWGNNSALATAWTRNDPDFTANDIVQSGSQCTVRVRAGDCDNDGICDWDEIVAAGALGDCNDNGVPDDCDLAQGGADINANGVLDACEAIAPGDINGDGVVNAADLGLLLAAWGSKNPAAADISGDGVVDAQDLSMLMAAWS